MEQFVIDSPSEKRDTATRVGDEIVLVHYRYLGIGTPMLDERTAGKPGGNARIPTKKYRVTTMRVEIPLEFLAATRH